MKEGFFYSVVIVFLALGILMFPVAYRSSAETISISVTGKERISQGSGDSLTHKYLVYTENETFENTDSILFLKFNSSDFQRRLDGQKTVTVAGWRVPFLSMYRNIVKIHNPHPSN